MRSLGKLRAASSDLEIGPEQTTRALLQARSGEGAAAREALEESRRLRKEAGGGFHRLSNLLACAATVAGFLPTQTYATWSQPRTRVSRSEKFSCI